MNNDNENKNEFENAYTEQGFWDKLAGYAKNAGKEVVEKALLLFYAAQEEKAPAWAKGTIAAALGYFIVPLDAVADITPGIGFTDDLGVLALAIAAVAAYINDDVRAKTTAKMNSWFGDALIEDQAGEATSSTASSEESTN
ncbi:MAG: uncharacterized membrane protein YkvA (DUF1232 family) [Halioglobus sp.]|jgi:uncharacterized membrane protein YkvA (DUF1232 family)